MLCVFFCVVRAFFMFFCEISKSQICVLAKSQIETWCVAGSLWRVLLGVNSPVCDTIRADFFVVFANEFS